MHGVLNLSSRPLSKDEITLLSRGLKFCPTPPCPDPGLGRNDLDELHRSLRLMSHFDDDQGDMINNTLSTQDNTDKNNLLSTVAFKHYKFKCKSNWRGPIGPTNLEAFIASNERDYNTRPVYRPPIQMNLSPGEREALKRLKQDNSIVIKPADKGTTVVVLNRLDYLREGYKQLGDLKYYKQVEIDLTEKHVREVNNLIEDMYQDSEIEEDTRAFLLDNKGKVARFYLLPKIHKNKIPPPGRPVVAGIGCPTEKISQFVDHFLNPCSIKVRSYTRDTNDFLNRISLTGTMTADTLLVTMDVTSLYTNIPNEEGLRASLISLERHRPGNVKPKNLTLIKLLEAVLKKNNFQFNGNNYLQVGGTAIGTKAAPAFAIVYMGMFEDMFVYTYPLQPVLYLRYIDDIFMLWQHGLTELNTFVEHLNSRVDTIKFTHETSVKAVSFLDVTVKLNNGSLETDLYCKPTDSHDYLLYSSAHPQKCKDSIPYSQFVRIRRLCTHVEDYDGHIFTLAAHFRRREYPPDLIMEAALAARRLDRSILLDQTKVIKEDEVEKVFLLTTYHPSDHSLRNLVRHNWDILGQSEQTSYLHRKKLTVGYRRPKNLRDVLVHAGIPHKGGDEVANPNHIPPLVATPDIGTQAVTVIQSRLTQTTITDHFKSSEGSTVTTSQATEPSSSTSTPGNPNRLGTNPSKRGFPFCNETKCRYCPKLNRSGHIISKTTGLEHRCMEKISCRSSNVIYCITCKRCKMQYVGQTYKRVKDRFVAHFYNIEEASDTSVARHFSQNDHNGVFDLEISVLEFIKKPPKSEAGATIRNRTERRWIHLLRTKAPQGMNIED